MSTENYHHCSLEFLVNLVQKVPQIKLKIILVIMFI